MQIKKSIRFCLLVFALLAVSCNTKIPATTAPSLLFTSLPPSFSPTTTPPPIATNTLAPNIDSSCWPIKPIQEADYVTGSFLYEEPINLPFVTPELKNTSLFAFDFSLLGTKRIDLNNRIQAAIFISPDSNKLAYEQDAKIFIIDRKGVQAYSLPDNEFLIDAYLKDGRIRLKHLWDNRNGYQAGKGLTLTYYIFDPTTGTTQKNAVFLPNYYENGPGDSTLHYSPDMKYVLYRSSSYGIKAEFTLFDLEKNKVAWIGPPRDKKLVFLADAKPDWLHIVNYRNAFLLNIQVADPDWLKNIDTLAALFLDTTTGQTRYYSISPSGEIARITDFDVRELIDGVWSQPESTFSLMSPEWSPNGRYLITVGTDKGAKSYYPGQANSLYIWDRQENIVYKPCLPNEIKTIIPPHIRQYVGDTSFIISLTFDSFAVPDDFAIMGRTSKIYYLDLDKKIIYEIPGHLTESSANTNDNTLKGFLGWVNWKIP
jgi:hypothetical protein